MSWTREELIEAAKEKYRISVFKESEILKKAIWLVDSILDHAKNK